MSSKALGSKRAVPLDPSSGFEWGMVYSALAPYAYESQTKTYNFR